MADRLLRNDTIVCRVGDGTADEKTSVISSPILPFSSICICQLTDVLVEAPDLVDIAPCSPYTPTHIAKNNLFYKLVSDEVGEVITRVLVVCRDEVCGDIEAKLHRIADDSVLKRPPDLKTVEACRVVYALEFVRDAGAGCTNFMLLNDLLLSPTQLLTCCVFEHFDPRWYLYVSLEIRPFVERCDMLARK